MSEVDKGYELKVLKMVINKYLDETISVKEESLKALKANRDQVVWDLAARIYSQSGHKVELYTVRNVVDSRIEAMKCKLVAEKEHIAEQARRVAEEKARPASEKADESALKYVPSREEIFAKIQKIISEQLDVDESKVYSDSRLSNDLGADDLDLTELVMALEMEFNIEISDEEAENDLNFYDYTSGSGIGSFWSMLGSTSAHPSSYSSSRSAGENCLVKNFLDLICKKVLA